MTDNFDPYHQWLGIPPEEQPPNHYRLLGIKLFESDRIVIDTMARRHIDYLQNINSGPRQEEASRLLNHLCLARRCLLDLAKKRAYDDGLRQGLEAAKSDPEQPRSTPANANESPPPIVAAPAVAFPSKKPTSSARRIASKKPAVNLPWLIGGVATILLIPVLWLAFSGEEAPQPVAQKPPEKSEPIKEPPTAPQAPVKEPEPPVAPPEPEPKEPVEPEPEPTEPEPTEPEPTEPEPTEPEPTEPEPTEPEPIPRKPLDVEQLTTEKGSLLREVWGNFKAGNTAEEFREYIQQHPRPDRWELIQELHPPEDDADYYGQRLRGYLYPPQTGEYEISIRANKEGFLFIREYDDQEEPALLKNKSKVQLDARKVYYFEGFHVETTGKDYIEIGWKTPDGSQEQPIPGRRFSPNYHPPQAHEKGFVALPLKSVEAGSLKVQSDETGRVLASVSKAVSQKTIYTIEQTTELSLITAFRMQAIPDPSLPGGGPGVGVGGRFSISEIRLQYGPKDRSSALQEVAWSSVVVHEEKFPNVQRMIDGDLMSSCSVRRRGAVTTFTLIPELPLNLAEGMELIWTISQREAIGGLRLWATSGPNAQNMPLDGAAPMQATDAAVADSRGAWRVNLGGPSFASQDGRQWESAVKFKDDNYGYEGGTKVSSVEGGDPLASSAIRGIQAFRAAVPDGVYDIELYFCENWTTKVEGRMFTVIVEGKTVIPNFAALLQTQGLKRPILWRIPGAPVKDGRLDIDFTPKSGCSTILNGVQIVRRKS